jgi:hypothetical protein
MTLLMRDDMLQIASLADCHVSKHAHASKAAAAGLRANARARGAGRVLTSAALPLIRAWCSLPLLPLPLTFASLAFATYLCLPLALALCNDSPACSGA